ncbi:G protein-coupled glucose receptor regulating Gpa2-domain-containing protein [Desarmillaria tabescens]|uniref:G protein-coupled glucose receptor regulating Gpa2-domain-containing protein n=1 Tax=Armillaria tabescens TaxID=1929756 RepID=A0AA39NR90_ARMTA|nr:G protein-coupled glucose receptor regulating Gpa2-domain-containing protein [Desarmillaria tabescens]KAK0470350.1 G protein-coupled glucose receptor regulating Gpa2-domain-containing protein [Desarmillaria tabescens]
MALSHFALALAVANFIGSTLSALGSGFIILCYVCLPVKRHYRHLLILNLAVADFTNGLNNGISGAFVLAKGQLRYNTACVANGFIGQLSVQATDTSIFAIAVVTVIIVTGTQDGWLSERTWWKVALVCASTWVLPIITSFVALGKGYYSAVSGNWCWIHTEPAYLRYVLTHAWRFLFIFSEIGLYAYLYIHLKKRFRTMNFLIANQINTSTGSSNPSHLSFLSADPQRGPDLKTHVSQVQFNEETSGEKFRSVEQPDIRDEEAPPPTQHYYPPRPSSAHVHHSSIPVMDEKRQRQVAKILLLNAYPIAYIVLWIPGLCNRLVEASGHTSRVLQLMQATTQFVGFANALTYGWNENVAKSMREATKR